VPEQATPGLLLPCNNKVATCHWLGTKEQCCSSEMQCLAPERLMEVVLMSELKLSFQHSVFHLLAGTGKLSAL
jgi:hypothetical protein